MATSSFANKIHGEMEILGEGAFSQNRKNVINVARELFEQYTTSKLQIRPSSLQDM